jgi:hypothetical protein
VDLQQLSTELNFSLAKAAPLLVSFLEHKEEEKEEKKWCADFAHNLAQAPDYRT